MQYIARSGRRSTPKDEPVEKDLPRQNVNDETNERSYRMSKQKEKMRRRLTKTHHHRNCRATPFLRSGIGLIFIGIGPTELFM